MYIKMASKMEILFSIQNFFHDVTGSPIEFSFIQLLIVKDILRQLLWERGYKKAEESQNTSAKALPRSWCSIYSD